MSSHSGPLTSGKRTCVCVYVCVTVLSLISHHNNSFSKAFNVIQVDILHVHTLSFRVLIGSRVKQRLCVHCSIHTFRACVIMHNNIVTNTLHLLLLLPLAAGLSSLCYLVTAWLKACLNCHRWTNEAFLLADGNLHRHRYYCLLALWGSEGTGL